MSLKNPGFGAFAGTGGSLHLGYTDNSGTPATATTINTPRGRFAFSTGTTVTVTCSVCAATSTVLCSFAGGDATAFYVSVVPGAGSFVVTVNAAATGNPKCDFVVFN